MPHITPELPDDVVKKLCSMSNGAVYIAAGPFLADEDQGLSSALLRVLDQVQNRAKEFDGWRLLELGRADYPACLQMEGKAEGLVLAYSSLSATIRAIDSALTRHRHEDPVFMTDPLVIGKWLHDICMTAKPLGLKHLGQYVKEVMENQRRAKVSFCSL